MTSDGESLPSMLSVDQPLKDSAQDRLGRRPFAEELAQSIITVRPDTGFVYSLTGPWGSGKTTVLNFTERFLQEKKHDGVIVVPFNAWWMSGSDRLLSDFFKQFRHELLGPTARELESFSEALTEYAAAFEPLPYIGRWAALLQGLGKIRKARNTDLNRLRQKIDGELANFSGRIVVVMDDIDRLRPDEIQLIFRLVKAVANFPRTIYILAYDEPVAAKAVGDGDLKAGREYLDKIVQLALTIPTPDQSTLKTWFGEDLNYILDGTSERLLNCAETHDRLGPFVDQFLTTPRHVVRFLNLLRATYPMVRGEVNALHFVFIQALRQFVPSLHTLVADNGDRFRGLHGGNENVKRDLEQGIRQALENDLGAGHTTVTETAQEILRRLFSGVQVMYPSAMADNCSIGRAEYFHRYFLLGVPPRDPLRGRT